MSERSVVALVPMRHHSERVRGKNYRSFAGRPLFHWIVETLSACPSVARIVIDTDSPVVAEGVREHFPLVSLIDRPAHLRAGTVAMNDVIEHDMAQVPAPHYMQTHSTNPLLRAETIERAIGAYFDRLPTHDSLFGVTRLQTRLWSADMQPINHDPAVLLRTQDLPAVYEENSCVYIFSGDGFRGRGNRLGARPQAFEIEAAESSDIDDELDFEVAEFLCRRDREGGRS
jgi:CMP-N-acetylneuraminic acid synthetase